MASKIASDHTKVINTDEMHSVVCWGTVAVQCMQCVALDEKCLSGTMAADIKFYGCCILDHNVLNVS